MNIISEIETEAEALIADAEALLSHLSESAKDAFLARLHAHKQKTASALTQASAPVAVKPTGTTPETPSTSAIGADGNNPGTPSILETGPMTTTPPDSEPVIIHDPGELD